MRTSIVFRETPIQFGEVQRLYPHMQISKRQVHLWKDRGLLTHDGRRVTLDWDKAGQCYTSVEAVKRFLGATNGEAE